MIGLCGSHRTGKTTLANHYAEIAGIPVVTTSSSKVLADLGYTPQEELPYAERMLAQFAILEDARDTWAKYRGQLFVTDRTPIDMIAYAIADISRDVVKGETDDRMYVKYRDECIKAVIDNFKLVVHVAPGIIPVEDATKAQVSIAYMEHIYILVSGLLRLSIPVHKLSIPTQCLDLEQRSNMMKMGWDAVLQAEAEGAPVKSN